MADELHVRNEAGDTSGPLVQAGVVHGGLHLHSRFAPSGPVPRQLPVAPREFTGREAETKALSAAFDHTDPHAGPVAVAAIGGLGGIGKTWLALHWAYREIDRFPDGQLHVDLRGFDPSGQPTPPAVAVRGFLDALGAEPQSIPVDFDAQVGLYRSLVAGKRMLILLDNARDTGQIVPLLPGTPTCTVLVTSRNRLTALAATQGARIVDLDVLSDNEARAVLVRQLSAERLAAEPGAVAELLSVCGGLPLALQILAARAQQHPDFPLTELTVELRDTSARLDALDAGDPRASLRTVLSWSCHALTTEAATVFALLGITPGPDVGLAAAASLTALPVGRTRMVLRQLVTASLVQEHVPGRYRMHDLIRLHATEQAGHDLAPEVTEEALRRVVGFYLHTAYAANRLLNPHRQPLRLDPPDPGVQPLRLLDDPAALSWFATEHPALLAAHHTATVHRWYTTVWQLAWTLNTFHHRRGHLRDQLAVWQNTLKGAYHLPDPTAVVRAHRYLGYAYADLGQQDAGIGHLHKALTLAEEHQDLLQQARAHRVLARVREQRGEIQQAQEHATRAWDLYRVLDEPVWEADTLNLVGWYTARLGEYDIARRHCQAALALHRQHQNPTGEANTMDSLGYIAHHSGHNRQAIDHYRRALTLYRSFGNAYEAADTLDNLGHAYAALGEYEQTRELWHEAFRLYQQQGRDIDAERVRRRLGSLDDEDPAEQ